MPDRRRPLFLSVIAVLFGLLALSDFTKPLQRLGDPEKLGIVLFGVRLTGQTSNFVLGPLTGIVLAAYAYGLWSLKSWVGPLSIVYAFYVPLNLVLFWYMQTSPDIPSLWSMLAYLAVALGGSIGTALYLGYHRELLA
jgi:hypothetical protein